MKGLFKVTYTYQSYKTGSYDGSKIEKTRELFLEYGDNKKPIHINTYRLGGFERASIEIVKTKYLRDMLPVELDVNIEHNEVIATISLNDFLDNALDHDEAFEDSILTIVDNSEDMDIEEALESLGYIEHGHDNSYNYCSDLENDIDFKIYTLGDSSDYIYDDSTIVYIREHHGLDARAGYSFKGIYKRNNWEGLAYLYDQHVSCWLVDTQNNEVDQYEGDSALCSMLNDYKIHSYNQNTQELKVINKNNEVFEVRIYSPAMGV